MDPSPDRDLVSAQRQGTSLHISRFLCCRMFDQCQTVRARNMAATRAWRRRRDSRSDYGGQGRGFHREGIGTFIAEKTEEHTSELQSLMRISYAVFCLKKKKTIIQHHTYLTRSHITKTEQSNHHI